MDQYLGEIRMFSAPSANNIPTGWLKCDGQILSVSQYTALFSLLSNTYGGDGKTTFALPDMRGRAAIGFGTATYGVSYALGHKDGSNTSTLGANNLPLHSHEVYATASAANTGAIAGTYFAEPAGNDLEYNNAPAAGQTVALASMTLSTAGAAAPVNNMQPFIGMSFYICATDGFYPERP